MVKFSVKMKTCPRLLIFEPSDCTLRIFRGYDFLTFFKYCYFWIDIWGFLTQTFEPAPSPVWLVMECPLGFADCLISHLFGEEELTLMSAFLPRQQLTK